MTLGALGLRQCTGQLTLVEGAKTYRIAFDHGAVVGASSPLASDAASRVALLNQLIAPAQVADVTRRVAAAPERDELELVGEVARLSVDQMVKLRRKVIEQRAARTFSVERGDFVVASEVDLPVLAGVQLDVRSVIYLGARMNLSVQRLSDELRPFGLHFAIKPDAAGELGHFGFTEVEQPILDALRIGTSLPELEAAHRDLDPRTAQAVVYALMTCSICEAVAPSTVPRPATSELAVTMKPAPADLAARTPTVPRTPLVPRTATQPSAPAESRTATLPAAVAPAARAPDPRAPRSASAPPATPSEPAPPSAPPRTSTSSEARAVSIASTEQSPPRPVSPARTSTSSGSPIAPRRPAPTPAQTPVVSVSRTWTPLPGRSNTTSTPFAAARTPTPPPSEARAPTPSRSPTEARTPTPRRTSGAVPVVRTQTDPAIPARDPVPAVPDVTPDPVTLAKEAFKRGEARMKVEDLASAIAEFTRAVEIAPNAVEYAVALAWVRFCAASDKQALAAITRETLGKAIRRSQAPEVPRFYLGRVERMLGRDKEALRHFQEVLELQPRHADAAAEIRVIEARLASATRDSSILRRKR